MWLAVPTPYRSPCCGSSTDASRWVNTPITFPVEIASSIRRTELSRATASGMNEFGNSTVSLSGRIGSSSGIVSTRLAPGSSCKSGVSSCSFIHRPETERAACRAALGLPSSRNGSVRHIEEECSPATLLRLHAFPLFRRFPRLFAILAANRERQGPQTRFGDFLAALEAVAVGALFEPPERFVDLVERLRLHLNKGKFDVFLNVDFRALALVEDFAILAAVGADIANLALDLVHKLATALLEHLSQLVIPVFPSRPLRTLRRRHDPYRSFPLRAPYVQL